MVSPARQFKKSTRVSTVKIQRVRPALRCAIIFAFGVRVWSRPQAERGVGYSCVVGFRARLHGSDTEISLHASGHPAPTSRSWAPGRGSNVGRVCVAVTCLSPSGVRFASWIFSFDCWPGLPAALRASRSVHPHPRRLVSRLCARRPASILAIGGAATGSRHENGTRRRRHSFRRNLSVHDRGSHASRHL